MTKETFVLKKLMLQQRNLKFAQTFREVANYWGLPQYIKAEKQYYKALHKVHSTFAKWKKIAITNNHKNERSWIL